MGVFCTDAGHGGNDTGAVWGGVAEKDINLQAVLKLNRLLKERGHRVFTTRKDDLRVPPLKTRCRLINAHHQQSNPHFDAIVSLNCNVAAYFDSSLNKYLPVPERRGLYAIYSRESEQGSRLANLIAEQCAKVGIPLSHNGILSTVELGRSLAWIHQTLPVAVLVEMGFLTNEEERNLLQQEDYQLIIVNAISDALQAFVQPSV